MSRIRSKNCAAWGVRRRHRDGEAHATGAAAEWLPVQSIGVIVGAVEPRRRTNPNPPADLTDRAMRKRGAYDQAALLADQAALRERSPERALMARQASKR